MTDQRKLAEAILAFAHEALRETCPELPVDDPQVLQAAMVLRKWVDRNQRVEANW